MQRSQSFGSLEEPDKEFEKDFRIQYQRKKKVQEFSQASNMENNNKYYLQTLNKLYKRKEDSHPSDEDLCLQLNKEVIRKNQT